MAEPDYYLPKDQVYFSKHFFVPVDIFWLSLGALFSDIPSAISSDLKENREVSFDGKGQNF